MVGSVFYQEMLLGARRGRWHIIRWIYAGWLVVQLFFWLMGYMTEVSLFHRREFNLSHLTTFAREMYVPFFTFQHFLLLIIITPILSAGAITDEKSRGTLQYLLTADLYSGEILIGKLLARSYQAFLLALIGMPLLCLLGSFSDLDLLKIAGFILCSLLLIFTVGAMSMLASVWCRHTRDAVLSMYSLAALAFALWYAGEPYLAGLTGSGLLQWAVDTLNPLRPLDVYWLSLPLGEYLARLLVFVAFWGALCLGCLLVASWRLRPAYVRQLEKSGKKSKLQWIHLRRPAIGNWPLVWKERYVEGIAPLLILRRIPRWFGVAVIFVLTTFICGWILIDHLPVGATPARMWEMILSGDWMGLLRVRETMIESDFAFYSQGWVILLTTVLIVGVRCSGAVTGEREKNTWEALLLTPLETHQLIRGKMWGIAGACVPYLAAYAVPALAISLFCGWGPFFWVLLWLGVIVLAVFYAGSAGIWCSVRSPGSWRSLLVTLGFIYGGGFVLFLALSMLAIFLAMFILLFLSLIEMYMYQNHGIQLGLVQTAAAFLNAWRIGLNLLLVVSFILLSWLLLRNAEFRVSIMDRIKHWRDEQYYEDDFVEEDRPRRRYVAVDE